MSGRGRRDLPVVLAALLLAACAASSPRGSPAGRPRHPSAPTTVTSSTADPTSCTPRVDRVDADVPHIPPSDDPQLHRHIVAEQLSRAAAARRRAELTRARRAAAGLRTVAAALRAGYVPTGGSTGDGEGVHFTNWLLVNCRFDPAHPSQLLYDGSTANAPLVAFSYYVVSDGRPPTGFTGPADLWHRHFGICVRGGQMLDRLEPQGHETLGSCQAQGAEVLDGRDLWMLHAWVVPAWPNRSGVFAALNPKLIRG
jgi:hypothetical protein